jgi:hypothetical protein
LTATNTAGHDHDPQSRLPARHEISAAPPFQLEGERVGVGIKGAQKRPCGHAPPTRDLINRVRSLSVMPLIRPVIATVAISPRATNRDNVFVEMPRLSAIG